MSRDGEGWDYAEGPRDPDFWECGNVEGEDFEVEVVDGESIPVIREEDLEDAAQGPQGERMKRVVKNHGSGSIVEVEPGDFDG